MIKTQATQIKVAKVLPSTALNFKRSLGLISLKGIEDTSQAFCKPTLQEDGNTQYLAIV